MKKILIISSRPEVGKFFQLLLWQSDRQFERAETVERGTELVRRKIPDLIIIDIQTGPQGRCLELCRSLKGSPEHAGIPLLLVCEPQQHDPEFRQLLASVDGVLPEPFALAEIKSTTAKYI